MAPLTITVIDRDGNESQESVANDSEFEALIRDYDVRCLVTNDSDRKKIRGVASLEDGGTYKLGPLRQHQAAPEQNGKLCCCFCILVFNCCFEYENVY